MLRPIAIAAVLSLPLILSAATPAKTPEKPHEPARISVPRGHAPVIDGVVDPKEWRDAARVVLTHNKGHALLMHDGNYMYIGFTSNTPGIGSLCVRGQTGVRVLHASAALGTAAFEPKDGKWELTRTFTWTNRDTSNSPQAKDDRRRMLATDRWFANTSKTAMLEREFMIPVRNQKEVPIVIGFLSFTRKEQKLYYWPEDVEDDCAEAELASGFTDREFTFDPSTWGIAVLEE